MCGRIIVLSYDEVLDVIRHLEVGAPLSAVPDWPARRVEAFPGSEVMAIVAADRAWLPRFGDAEAGGRPNAASPSAALRFTAGSAQAGGEAAAAPDGLSGTLSAASFVWGFEARWNGRLVYNTRIETASKPGGLWERAIERGRCVVPTLGFFEPHRTETVPSPRTGKPVKRPYAFGFRAPEDEAQPEAFAPTLTLLGGVSDNGRLSIVTTEPNDDVAPVHDRMPLVLAPHEVATWLSPDYARLADRSAVRLLRAPAQPAPSRQARRRGVSPGAPGGSTPGGSALGGSAPGGSMPGDQLSLF